MQVEWLWIGSNRSSNFKRPDTMRQSIFSRLILNTASRLLFGRGLCLPLLFLALIPLLLANGALADSKPSKVPNIILILADDLGYECIAANGGESYQTPNLDELAKRGIRFEQCHVQPLCTPTRVQLMTGKYNIRNYLRFGLLPTSENTFANLLKAKGYATGICGKWQLGKDAQLPQHFGFDESFLWQHTRRPPRYANPGLEKNGAELNYSDGEYGPKLVNDFAIDFIARHKAGPFLLYYPMMLTHDPFQATPDSADWDPKARGEKTGRAPKHFGEMVNYMDKMVGRLLSTLDELKIRENTIVIFVGDNGTHSSITSQFKGTAYRGGKGSTNCRGTHVPLIVSWPQAKTQNAVSQDLISSVDFLPTLCEAAGAAVPDNIDGMSFLPQLRGEPGKSRDWLYTWYSPRQNADRTVSECAFDHDYKLYRTGEFYSLSSDPFEKQALLRDTLSESQVAGFEKLQRVLDQFKDARPTRLDRELGKLGNKKKAK
jgi:arylsulfatase A